MTAFDTIVVGSGPAGLSAALAAAEKGARVLLCERLRTFGLKLLASGGSKCNVSNVLDESAFMSAFGREGRFMKPALDNAYHDWLFGFLKSRNVPLKCVDSFHYFPKSERARDVLNAFSSAFLALGGTMRNECRIDRILTECDSVSGVETADGEIIPCRAVVLAGGGTAWPTLGGGRHGLNLAAALAAQGFNVGILDVDLHGPSVPHLLGSHGFVRVDNEDGKLVPVSCGERLALISIESFLEDKDAAIIWRGPKKVGAIQQFVADVKWGALDYLLIDSPPGTGDEHMTILDAIPDAKCVVVTTPQEISLADVRKALDFLKVVKADVLGLVENMSGLFCPHCGEEIDLFKKGGGEALAKQEGLNFLGAIPLDPATVVAADRGHPIVSMPADTPAKAAFLKLAETVREATQA